MLETVREYASECMAAREDREDITRRHADHYLALAEQAQNAVRVANSAQPYARLDAERDNMRAALRFYEDAEAAEEWFRFIQALSGYWLTRGDLREGHGRVHAEVLASASDFARLLGDADLATVYAERSLALAREIADPARVARALHELGESVQDPRRATELFHEAVVAAREAGQSGAGSIVNLGEVALAQGDYEEAAECSTEALELYREEDSLSTGALVAQFNLASALFHLRRVSEARLLFRETLLRLRELGYSEGQAWCVMAAAAVLANDGRTHDAGRLLGAAEAMIEEIGVNIGPSERNLCDIVTRGLDEATLNELREAGRRMARDEALDLALQSLD
jgi:tetratricopeptide (TPR) repeat protein